VIRTGVTSDDARPVNSTATRFVLSFVLSTV
jgi:hypothetical protein